MELVATHADPAAVDPKPLPHVPTPTRQRVLADRLTAAPSVRLVPERPATPRVEPARPARERRRLVDSVRGRIPGGRGGGRRRLAAIGAIALMGGAGLALVTTRGGQTAATPLPLDVAGHVEAVQTHPLDFGVAGEVVSVGVKAGQDVEPGTVLASLDTAQLAAQLRAAKDALITAQQKLSLDTSGNPGALAQAAALAGVDSAQQQANAAATNYNDTKALTLAALQGSQLAGQAAAKQLLATAQLQLAASQANLVDTARVNQTAVDVANQALDAAVSGGQVQVQAGQVQLRATQKTANDQQQLNAKTVNVAQATLKGDQAIVAQDQAAVAAATDCPTGPVCLAARATLTKDQATVRTDQATVAQAQAAAKLSNDQANAQANLAQVALNAAQTSLESATDAARANVNQEIAKGIQSNNQAAAVVKLAQIGLQDALDTTTGAASQNFGLQNVLKAQQAIDQAQIQLDASLVAANSARRELAALHAPPAVQLVLTDQSGVDTAQAQVDLSQHNLGAATLVAPVRGVVQQLNIAVGQQVPAGAVGGATPGGAVPPAGGGVAAAAAPLASSLVHAILLETPDAFQLSGAVRETDVAKLKLGDRVSVVTAASPQAFDGTITDIAPAGTLRGSLVTFGVTATFEAPGSGLRPGMTARMRVLGVTTGGTSSTTSSTSTSSTTTSGGTESSETTSSETTGP